jgi:hypothetical protein
MGSGLTLVDLKSNADIDLQAVQLWHRLCSV